MIEERERVEVLAEVLRERLPGLRHIIDEWSVPQADPLSYAQAKDLIAQIAAPLGLALVGFSAAERARRDDPGDLDTLQAQALFARAGEELSQALDRFLAIAAQVRL